MVARGNKLLFFFVLRTFFKWTYILLPNQIFLNFLPSRILFFLKKVKYKSKNDVQILLFIDPVIKRESYG